MRKPASIMASLILLGLVPIGVWAWLAYALVDVYLFAQAGGRKGGQAVAIMFFIVLLFTPALLGGIMMVWGGALLARKPRTGRTVASIGTAIVLVSIAVSLLSFFGANAPRGMVFAAIAYLLVHCGLIAWLWLGCSAPAERWRRVDGQRSSG